MSLVWCTSQVEFSSYFCGDEGVRGVVMLPEDRAYSRRFVRPTVCPSVRPSIRPSHFCPEHISKSIDGNLMKLDTLIEGYEENCRMQERNHAASIYGITFPF